MSDELELYKKYRPKSFKEVLGQPEVLAALQEFGKRKKLPHTLLFVGPSGTGKTTVARILRGLLHCGDQDFVEKNCADFRGIDMVRDVRDRMMLKPISGNCRIWLIDEAHRLTGEAQDAFLKILEDTPRHVYFMLCTTDPQKLKNTIITRSTVLKFRSLSAKDLEQLLSRVVAAEQAELGDEVAERIVNYSNGSPRKALVLLDSVLQVKDPQQQLAMIERLDFQAQGIQLARLLFAPGTKWAEVAAVIQQLEDDLESLRHMILSYAQKVLLGGGKQAERAYNVINSFREPWYECKKAGLTAACWEIISPPSG